MCVCGCDCVGEEGSVWGVALIVATKYDIVCVCVCVCVGREGEGEWVWMYGCDSVGGV